MLLEYMIRLVYKQNKLLLRKNITKFNMINFASLIYMEEIVMIFHSRKPTYCCHSLVNFTSGALKLSSTIALCIHFLFL